MGPGKNQVVLAILLAVATLLALSLFLIRRAEQAPVVIAYKAENYRLNALRSPGKDEFWENYPAQVMASKDQSLSPSLTIYDTLNRKRLLRDVLDGQLVFRFVPGKEHDSAIVMSVEVIKEVGVKVVFLADEPADNMDVLKARCRPFPVFYIKKPLPLSIESEYVPYFFSLDAELKTRTIYVPRIEVPQVLLRYLKKIKEIKE